MATRYATGLLALFEGYPLSLTLSIPHAIQRPLYFERSYLSSSGAVLAIRATLISERGVVSLTEFGPVPPGTTSISACVTTENRATESDPAVPTPPEAETGPKFATHLETPVLWEHNPLQLAIGIGEIRQPLYLERSYLDINRSEIGRRSDVIYNRAELVAFNIHQPEPFAGTRWINVCIRNTYNPGTGNPEDPGTIFTMEYELLEFNELEYN
ncbi:hypothetical protein GCM10023188_25870 [Pontibacter saemangeumensis]|uniref:Uncharacterized protein n=1 Tax=Pontibacter saemangeumensis TaxID=1084525 RepID=A0ABP8LUD0_9BACT